MTRSLQYFFPYLLRALLISGAGGALYTSRADGSWNGTVPQVGPADFGGFIFCEAQITLQNVQMGLTVSKSGYSSTVQCVSIEQNLFGCFFPPIEPNVHHYEASGASVTRTGNNFHIVYAPDPLNAPQASLVFDGTLQGNSINGFLSWHRIDQPPPLDWSLSTSIQITTTPMKITCPADITICSGEGTAPTVTGVPTVEFSCSPPDDLLVSFVDEPPNLIGTFARIWTAFDPLCGTTVQCVQIISILQNDIPSYNINTGNDGLTWTFHAFGTRGTILQSQWVVNDEVLTEGTGVHFVDTATVVIDLRLHPFLPGSLGFRLEVQTTCGPGMIGTVGTGPPVFSLSRSLFTADNLAPGGGTVSLTVQCGDPLLFDPASRSFRFNSVDAGAALISASSPSARLVVLNPGTSLIQATALACGTQSIRFAAQPSTTYVVIVESTETFSMSSQIVDPQRTIVLSGNLAFGTIQSGAQATRTFTINNNGNLPLNVTSISYPPGYNGNWLGGLIQLGMPQNVIVTFRPSIGGTYNGNIVVNSDATSGNNILGVSGSATVASTKTINVTGNLAFGSIPAGSTKTLTFTITSSGNTAVNVASIQYPAGYSGNWAGGLVQPGAPRNVTVTFNPLSAGTYNGNVVVNSDATSGNNILAITGNATVVSTKTINVTGNLAFGSIPAGSTKTLDFTIASSGNTAVNVASIQYPAGFSGNWAGGLVQPGTPRNVAVTFNPLSAGTYNGNIVVNSDATSGNNTLAVTGSGTVVSTKTINVTGNLAFGSIPSGSTKTLDFTITSTGNTALNVASIRYPAGYNGNWAGSLVEPGTPRNVTVSFNPSTAGTYNGNILVNSDATSGNNSIAVSGQATPQPASSRIISLSGNLAFGNVGVGSSKTGTLTIQNNGSSVLTVSNITFPEAVTGDWSAGQIAPQTSKAVTITFKPARPGVFFGNIQVMSDATSGGSAFAIQGTGSVLAFASAELKPPANGLFQVSINAPAGKTLILEASADFRLWTQVARLPTSGFQLDLNDLIPKNARVRFYRFRLE